jgi:hypothetical protein
MLGCTWSCRKHWTAGVLPTRPSTSQHLCISTTLPNNITSHTTVHPRPTAAIRRKKKDNENILTTEHPAAYLHNKFPDTIVRYLIYIIPCNGIPENTKLS